MNLVETASELTAKEKDVLNKIKDKVSSTLGIPVMLDLGKKSDCGQFTIASQGFVAWLGQGAENSPFVVNRAMLSEMAEDEEKFQEWMKWIQERMGDRVTSNFTVRNSGRTEQENAERSQQMSVNMMAMLDFWNNSRGEGWLRTQPIQGQAYQKMIERYEQMLSFQS